MSLGPLALRSTVTTLGILLLVIGLALFAARSCVAVPDGGNGFDWSTQP